MAEGRSTRIRRFAFAGTGAILILSAIVAVVVVLVGGVGETDWRILGTLASAFVCGSTGTAGLELLERREALHLARFVVATAPVEFVILAVAVWADPGGAGFVNFVITVVAFLLSGLTLAVLRLLGPAHLVFLAVCVFVGLTDGVAIWMIWDPSPHETGVKALIVLLVLVVLGFLLTPIGRRLRLGRHRA